MLYLALICGGFIVGFLFAAVLASGRIGEGGENVCRACYKDEEK